VPGHVASQPLEEMPAGMQHALGTAILIVATIGAAMEVIVDKRVQAAMQMMVPMLVHAVKVEMAVLMAVAVPVSVVLTHDRSFAIHILRYI